MQVAAVGLVLAGLGLGWRYPTLLGVGLALLAAVAIDLVLVRRVPALEVERDIDPALVERQAPCAVTVRLSGRLSGVGRVVLTDRAGSEEHVLPPGAYALTYPVSTRTRGLITVGPLTVTRHGLFGLATASSTVSTTREIRVVPRLLPVRVQGGGRRRSAVGGDESAEHGGIDLVGLHEYVPGDDLRRLHWATSARTGIPMVREDADPASPHLTVVLDDRAEHYADPTGPGTDFEEAAEAAYALCRAAAGRQPVHLVTTSGTVDLASGDAVAGRETGLRRIDEVLAEVHPARAEGVRAQPPLRLARTLDTVIVISGARVPGGIGEYAARGRDGALLLVDPEARPGPGLGAAITTAGNVRILRGTGAVALLEAWERSR